MGKCYNSVIVPAPLDRVWAAVRNFHQMSWATGVLESCEVVGGLAGDQIGARRILNNAFHETLRGLSDLEHVVEYSIDDGPGPVARDAVRNYVGRLQLHAVTDDDTTFAEWTSTYDSADSGAVGDLCNPVYHALLQAMKNYFA